LPAQLREIERRWQVSLKAQEKRPFEINDSEVSQLIQSLGQARYIPADGVLRRFVPKRVVIGQESRAAAIWALGLIHMKAPTPVDLVEQLIERLTDDDSLPEEDIRVRRSCAIALGQMKAATAL